MSSSKGTLVIYSAVSVMVFTTFYFATKHHSHNKEGQDILPILNITNNITERNEYNDTSSNDVMYEIYKYTIDDELNKKLKKLMKKVPFIFSKLFQR